MALTIAEIKKIATLARIKLSPEEEKRHAETISAVLDYMKILNEVDTDEVEPTAQVTGIEDITRSDELRECLIKKELLGQMPQVELNELVVPAVFNHEE